MNEVQAAFIGFSVWLIMVSCIMIAFKIERIAKALEKANADKSK